MYNIILDSQHQMDARCINTHSAILGTHENVGDADTTLLLGMREIPGIDGCYFADSLQQTVVDENHSDLHIDGFAAININELDIEKMYQGFIPMFELVDGSLNFTVKDYIEFTQKFGILEYELQNIENAHPRMLITSSNECSIIEMPETYDASIHTLVLNHENVAVMQNNARYVNNLFNACANAQINKNVSDECSHYADYMREKLSDMIGSTQKVHDRHTAFMSFAAFINYEYK